MLTDTPISPERASRHSRTPVHRSGATHPSLRSSSEAGLEPSSTRVGPEGRLEKQSDIPEAVFQNAGAAPSNTNGHRSIIPKKRRGKNHRSHYTLRIEAGFIVALLILLGLVRSPLYTPQDEFEIALAEQQTIQIEEIQQTRQELPPPPPPRPSVPIEVADDVVLEDDELNLDVTLDMDEPAAVLPAPPPPPVEEEPEPEEPEIFVVVEEMPEMIGGHAALMREVVYPPMARQAGVEGLVVVQFVVDENGNPVNPFIVKGIGAGCDEAAMDAVMKMKFKPGRQRGKAVRVQYSIPVRFRLQEVKR